MMDFWPFSISNRELFSRSFYSGVGVEVEYEIKGMVVVGFGEAE